MPNRHSWTSTAPTTRRILNGWGPLALRATTRNYGSFLAAASDLSAKLLMAEMCFPDSLLAVLTVSIPRKEQRPLSLIHVRIERLFNSRK